MTEADWRATTDVDAMLGFLSRRLVRNRPPSARYTLFARACARRVWTLLPAEFRDFAVRYEQEPPPEMDTRAAFGATFESLHERLHAARQRAGQSAEAGAAAASLNAQAAAAVAVGEVIRFPASSAADGASALAARAVGWAELAADWPNGSVPHPDPTAAAARGHYFPSPAERAAQADLVRCVFGNPFRPVAFEVVWRTEAVVALARGMDEARDFAALPVLADALEDAGCADAELLAHCRGAGPHARGCHAIDHVLGRW